MKLTETQFALLLKTLTEIGIALSTEKDHISLLEMILMKAQDITGADGGTVYTCIDNKTLTFEIMINRSMGIHVGGTSTNQVNYADLPLYGEDGTPNNHILAACATNSKQTINIKNVYSNRKFDLSATKNFDKTSGYHSQSLLTVPMMNNLDDVVGVLQLVNPINKKTKKIIPFSKLNEQIVRSLSSQAALTMTNSQLIKAQKELFNALIQLIAKAIDEKSPYTGEHCRRVPIITRMLAKATCQIAKGPLKDFTMTDEELYELDVAAWLHDCGKITTPEAIVDKATKLEAIYDRIHLINARFDLLKRDLIIETLQKKLQEVTGHPMDLHEDNLLQEKMHYLDKEREIIRQCNIGSESILPEQLQAITEIATRKWTTSDGKEAPFLSDEEVKLLVIPRGTLSVREREIINNHVSITIKMLESLPYPKNLKNVPQLAGCHHEKINGTGYPRGLTKEQIPLAARMVAIADIFEALTSGTRPYKKAMFISQALSILGQMKLDGHIDPDLFDVFMDAKIYHHYAKKYLDQNIYDVVDLNKIPGYVELIS